MTEAVAMMMQDLQKRGNILADYVPQNILNDYKKTFVEGEIKFLMDTDTLRKKLGVTSGDDAHIFGLKADHLGNLLIIAV